MRNRIIVVFLAGALCSALAIGAAFGGTYFFGDEAHAQNAEETWQVKAFPMSPYGDASWGEFGAWVQDMPVSCDVETVVVPVAVTTGVGTSKKNINDASILAYYRCLGS